LRKSLFETINVTREGGKKDDKITITDEDVYNRAELFSLYNFLHGYSLGEQIDFYGLKDKYLEKKKRKTRDDEVIPGGRGYRFQEYPIVTTDTLKKYLGKTAIKKDDELEFHRRKKTIREDKEDKDKGYRDISGKKIDYYFKEGKFRHVVSDEEMVKQLLGKGFRKPMITKEPSEKDKYYFEFHHPVNVFKRESETKSKQTTQIRTRKQKGKTRQRTITKR